jgi:glycosyltransferase involved in cell wall biosynthesis
MKVALIHDYLIDFGGAERVLLALSEIWPDAPIYTAITDKEKMGLCWTKFAKLNIKTSWFQKVPSASRLISPLRFLLPLVWESFDLSGYDLVVSSSSWAISKGVITGPSTKHVCYCHTPPRFLYHYPEARRWTRYWPVKIYAALVNHHLTQYDFTTSQRVDKFIANSKNVAGRIKKFYRRDSKVVYPPINLPPKSKVTGKHQGYYLCYGRLISYKHPDLAVKACQKLGRKIIVAGGGPMHGQLIKLAGKDKNTYVLGRVSEQKLDQLLTNCRAVILPLKDEDFGMVYIEAQGYGKPVIALNSGGGKEAVIPDKTGVFFEKPTVASLAKAILRFEKIEKTLNTNDIRAFAEKFSKDRFKKEIKQICQKPNA